VICGLHLRLSQEKNNLFYWKHKKWVAEQKKISLQNFDLFLLAKLVIIN
jgi:hypothetical protein